MCLIAFACKVHPDFPLLLVANRDEFHARPAQPLGWWPDAPQLLAGRDLQEGGAWLGVSRSGRVAAVTNVRSPDANQRRPLSRGKLVSDFLAGDASAREFAASLQAEAPQFGGFNLLLFDGAQLRYLSNRPDYVSRSVEPGVRALSNAQLDTPWPKARAAKGALQAWIDRGLEDESALIAAMANPAQAPDDLLPETGVGMELERTLSAAFIRTPSYGTRCTSLLRLDRNGMVDLLERRYDAGGQVAGETRESFRVGR